MIGLSEEFGPNVAAYRARLEARDGFRRAVRAQEEAAAAIGTLDGFGRPVEAEGRR
jgi:hypothetical protein